MGMASFFGKDTFEDGGMHKGYRGEDIRWHGGPLIENSETYSSIDSELAKILDVFAMETSKEGIELILVKYPECYPMVEYVGNLWQSDSIFFSVSNKYSLPVLDYYYSDIAKDKSNYHDYNHLNKKGSKLFTIQLCKDVDSLFTNQVL
jgi:hypothetical protein